MTEAHSAKRATFADYKCTDVSLTFAYVPDDFSHMTIGVVASGTGEHLTRAENDRTQTRYVHGTRLCLYQPATHSSARQCERDTSITTRHLATRAPSHAPHSCPYLSPRSTLLLPISLLTWYAWNCLAPTLYGAGPRTQVPLDRAARGGGAPLPGEGARQAPEPRREPDEWSHSDRRSAVERHRKERGQRARGTDGCGSMTEREREERGPGGAPHKPRSGGEAGCQEEQRKRGDDGTGRVRVVERIANGGVAKSRDNTTG